MIRKISTTIALPRDQSLFRPGVDGDGRLRHDEVQRAVGAGGFATGMAVTCNLGRVRFCVSEVETMKSSWETCEVLTKSLYSPVYS